jgi:hypothetical protein
MKGGDFFFWLFFRSLHTGRRSQVLTLLSPHIHLLILIFVTNLAKLTNFCFWYYGGVLSPLSTLRVCSVRRLLDFWYIDTTYKCYHVFGIDSSYLCASCLSRSRMLFICSIRILYYHAGGLARTCRPRRPHELELIAKTGSIRAGFVQDECMHLMPLISFSSKVAAIGIWF